MTFEPTQGEPREVPKDAEEQLRRRLEAVERIASANVEDVPDPDELSRQLNAKYDWSWMYDDETDRA